MFVFRLRYEKFTNSFENLSTIFYSRFTKIWSRQTTEFIGPYYQYIMYKYSFYFFTIKKSHILNILSSNGLLIRCPAKQKYFLILEFVQSLSYCIPLRVCECIGFLIQRWFLWAETQTTTKATNSRSSVYCCVSLVAAGPFICTSINNNSSNFNFQFFFSSEFH